MTGETLTIEGTWEEIAARGAELAGRRVRLIVFPEDDKAGGAQVPPGGVERPWDLDAFLASPSPVTDEEADALWDAIAEDRRKRRARTAESQQ